MPIQDPNDWDVPLSSSGGPAIGPIQSGTFVTRAQVAEAILRDEGSRIGVLGTGRTLTMADLRAVLAGGGALASTRGFWQGARPTTPEGFPPEPKYLPDWSIKFNLMAPNGEFSALTIDQLWRLKDEAYNRCAYFKYRAAAAEAAKLGDAAFLQSMCDLWEGVFQKVDAALQSATTGEGKLKSFLSERSRGSLIYGEPYTGPTIGSEIDPREIDFAISRPYSLSIEQGFLVAFGAPPSPTTPNFPDTDDSTGYTQPKDRSRRAMNPDVAMNEHTANRLEAAAALAQAMAGGLNEALNGGRAVARTWTEDGGRYIEIVSNGTVLSAAAARYILVRWLGIDAADLPRARDE